MAEDLEGREELIRRTGQLAVPVTVIDDEVVLGFNRPRLVELLGLRRLGLPGPRAEPAGRVPRRPLSSSKGRRARAPPPPPSLRDTCREAS